jgi:hypothetical protein
VCRELLWLARFGEFGPSSQPHLDHLAGCRHCRDEVGFDRAMVQQLRIALAERVEDAAPSPDAFQAILARARQPEQRRWFVTWAAALGRLRFATAMAGTGLALVLALNMEVVRVDVPDAGEPRPVEAALQQVPRMPTGRTTLVALGQHGGRGTATVSQPDPEDTLMWAATMPVAPASSGGAEQAADEVTEAPTVELRVAFQPFQTHDPAVPAPAADDPDDGQADWVPVELSQGEPS